MTVDPPKIRIYEIKPELKQMKNNKSAGTNDNEKDYIKMGEVKYKTSQESF